MYKVSVIAPVYNAENTIEKTLQSLLNQTIDNIQIILVNDGSTDSTKNIIEKYQRENVLIIDQENTGVSGARNRGMEEAFGEYLFFIDADDYIDSNALEVMYKYAKKNDLDLVSCDHNEPNSTAYHGNNNTSNEFIAKTPENIGQYFLQIFPQSACAKLFRYSLIQKYNLRFILHVDLGEDQIFTYQYLMIAKKVGKVKGVCYHIENVNPNSLSKKYILNMRHNISLQLSYWNDLIAKYPSIEKTYYKTHIDFEYYWIFMFVNNLFKKDCPLSWYEKKKEIKKWILENNLVLKRKIHPNKKPKNFMEFIMYMIFKTKNTHLIGFMFFCKELIKSRKVY